MAALDAQDFTALSDLLVEDCVIHLPDGTDRVGRDAAFQVIRGFYTSVPDYTHGIEEMIAEGDLVAVRVKYGGTHQGEFLGVAPTGRQVDYAGMFFVKVADGVLTEVWFVDDDLNLLSQLGMEVVPKGSLD
jgi:predicted ester cyclase